MKAKYVFLISLYYKKGIGYKQAKLVFFYTESEAVDQKIYVLVECLYEENKGLQEKGSYDYLVKARGP